MRPSLMLTNYSDEIAIIPARDEAPRIGAVIAGLRAALPNIVVVIIDDASRDGTEEVARRSGARVLTHPYNLGYGAALETGYRYALEGGYARCLQLDGDGQHDPTDASALLGPLRDGSADVVIGSRFLRGTPADVPRARRAGSSVMRLLARVLAGLECSDPTSGYQALDRRSLQLLARVGLPDDFPDLDVLIALKAAGRRIREVPVRVHPRLTGRSMHSGLRPVYYTYKMGVASVMSAIRGVHGMDTDQ